MKATATQDPGSRPIFILGCPRSGTSLLSRILNAHPRIGVPYESHLYNSFYALSKRYGDLAQPSRARRLLQDIYSTDVFRDWDYRPDIDQVLATRRRDDFHGLVDALLSLWAAHHGKPRWGEKTPWHGQYWPVIREAFPDARAIHMVRDGRDVAMSWVAARFGPKHLAVAVEKWRNYLDMMRGYEQGDDAPRIYTLRYTDLVHDSQAELEKLCAFLGETYDPAMLAFYKNEHAYQTDARNAQKLKTPLNPASVGKWKGKLTDRQIGELEAIGGDMLDHYGYERQAASPRLGPTGRLGYRACNTLLRSRSILTNTKGWTDAARRAVIRARLTLNPPR